MNPRVLFVDDDVNLLASLQRQFRLEFPLEIATSAEEGLTVLQNKGPFAVVVSDYRMPGQTGTELLRQVCELSPDTARILLTGYADLPTAMDAINRGHIFRFLTKPCPADLLLNAIRAGLEQYSLIHAQRDLLENTLRTSLEVLADVLAMASPRAFGQSSRVWKLVARLAEVLKVPDAWRLDVAAMLALLGWVSIPDATLGKLDDGEALNLDEEGMILAHPRVAHELLAHIPRLREVAEIILYQNRRFDGWDHSKLPLSGTAIPLGARILKVATDYDALVRHNQGPRAAYQELEARHGHYDPQVLAALKQAVANDGPGAWSEVALVNLRPGMILGNGLFNRHGMKLMGEGLEVTPALLTRIRNLADRGQIREPVAVWVPPKLAQELALAAAADAVDVIASA